MVFIWQELYELDDVSSLFEIEEPQTQQQTTRGRSRSGGGGGGSGLIKTDFVANFEEFWFKTFNVFPSNKIINNYWEKFQKVKNFQAIQNDVIKNYLAKYYTAQAGGNIDLLYHRLLGRFPTKAEKSKMINLLMQGKTLEDLQVYLMKTDEFYHKQFEGDLRKLYFTLAGAKPNKEIIDLMIAKIKGGFEMWQIEDLIRSFKSFRQRFPGIPQGWNWEDWNNFRREANRVWMQTRGRPIEDDEVAALLTGGRGGKGGAGW